MFKFKMIMAFVAFSLILGCNSSEQGQEGNPLILSLDDPQYHQINKPLTFDYYESAGITCSVISGWLTCAAYV